MEITDARKAELVQTVRELFPLCIDPGDPVPLMCAQWAYLTGLVLQANGIPTRLMAGSAAWRRIRPEEDDGKILSHYSYVWDIRAAAFVIAMGVPPELHCWVETCDGETVDLTTRYLPQNCFFIGELDWTAPPPPDYLWARALPQGWHYWPDPDALAFIIESLKCSNFVKKTLDFRHIFNYDNSMLEDINNNAM